MPLLVRAGLEAAGLPAFDPALPTRKKVLDKYSGFMLRCPRWQTGVKTLSKFIVVGSIPIRPKQ